MEPKGVRSGVGSNNMAGALIVDPYGVYAGPGASADSGADADPGGETDFGGVINRPFGTEIVAFGGQFKEVNAAATLW